MSTKAGHLNRAHELNLSSTVLRACDILRAFEANQEVLRLRDIVARTGLNKTTALRLLHTLQEGGLIESASDGRYRPTVRPIQPRLYRIGLAGQNPRSAFCREVSDSIAIAAELAEVDLIALSDDDSQRVAMRNAKKLIEAKVDLVIGYQGHDRLAPSMALRFQGAGIPFIAVSFPHPGAVYYGPNNYAAGVGAGRALGAWAKRQSKPIQEFIVLGRSLAGPITQARIKGIEAGLIEVFPPAAELRAVHLDGNAEFSQSFDVVGQHLRNSSSERLVLGALNDESALGALFALHQLARSEGCAVVSQEASTEGRAELRRPGTRLLGSVAFFPEKYGHDLLTLALRILQKRPVPASVFVDHVLITPKNVDLYYPQDPLAASTTA